MVTLLESQYPQDAIRQLTSCLDTKKLLDLARRFSETYKSLAKNSTEHFLVTPVTALPTGEEKGKFLVIDVGGSNLRVGFVELVGDLAEADSHESGNQEAAENVSVKIKRSHDRSWPIEDHLKMDMAEELFAWIGDCIAEVVRDAIGNTSIAEDEELLLGVTFSFPMVQTSLSEATLLPMGKGFAITTDLNLGEMLLAGYSSHCVSSMKGSPVSDQLSATNGRPLPIIRVAAITNDTVATFVSLAYAVKATPNSRVVMGLIVGTGTNATVPIRPDNLHPEKRSQLQNLKAAEAVVINTEWTIRGTDEPLEALGIKTQWDRTLDANSEVPGFQPFEYMTSGRYLGEIVRLIFIDVVCAEDMDEGCMLPSPLRHKNAIPTRLLSEVVARVDEDSLRDRLEKIYPSIEPNIINFWTLARVRLLRQIAQAVQQRSSALIAAACIGLLGCSGDINLYETAPLEPDLNCNASDATSNVEELVIAYTGSTISQYPHWLEDCQKWIDTLVTASKVNSGRKIVMKEAIDGGIIGAGVLAGMGDTITS